MATSTSIQIGRREVRLPDGRRVHKAFLRDERGKVIWQCGHLHWYRDNRATLSYPPRPVVRIPAWECAERARAQLEAGETPTGIRGECDLDD